eukprot:CAMPEP_0185525654 /NCGR_PEP_ID=MMETSP1366-20130426/91276_1 /TAXON_ID=38817 /ORGANISM="Gephyrocapsa oceanica, Strain RCC1303" /LENGTH=108 /DNA_ID=CAMNT_0028137065 /DNA_START=434 /DNA_END=757 /DNA_ORIENTATION=+
MGGVLLPLGGNKGFGDTLVEGVTLDHALAHLRQPPSNLGQDHLLVAEAALCQPEDSPARARGWNCKAEPLELAQHVLLESVDVREAARAAAPLDVRGDRDGQPAARLD